MRKSFLLVTLTLIVGCTPSSNFPKTYPASGTVTLNGKAVEGATVNFYPVEGKGSSVGTTDANGKYKLTTFRSDDGAPAGQYKVSIIKYDAANPAPTSAPAGGEAAKEIDFSNYTPPPENAGPAMPTTNKGGIPAKYSNAESSGLRGLVDEGSENVNDFPLK